MGQCKSAPISLYQVFRKAKPKKSYRELWDSASLTKEQLRKKHGSLRKHSKSKGRDFKKNRKADFKKQHFKETA
jgi:hypothetical protein